MQYIHTYMHTNIRTYMHNYKHVYVYICIKTYICAHMYLHIDIHIHTYTCIDVQTFHPYTYSQICVYRNLGGGRTTMNGEMAKLVAKSLVDKQRFDKDHFLAEYIK